MSDERSEQLAREKEVIRRRIMRYAEDAGVTLNPDAAAVETVLDRLAERKVDLGEFYCPSRDVTGDRELDRKSVCPCDFHLKEVAEEGRCHCGLFVREEGGPRESGDVHE